jgi:hypothetical protein
MIEAFDIWLNVPKADLEAIKSIVRMLHNASLLYVPSVHVRGEVLIDQDG